MLEVMYRLFEMMALLVCLHNFSGKKFKLDVYNMGFILLELAFMQMIKDNIVSKEMYFLMYIMYFIYAYIKFRADIKIVVLKCLLSISFTVCLQMIIYVPISFLYYIVKDENIIIFLINLIVFIAVFVTRRSRKYVNIATFCEKKDWVLWGCLTLSILATIYCIFSLKVSNVINIDMFILVSLFVIVFSVFLHRWQKSTYELQKKEREIEIMNLYNGVFEELIDSIRKKQHDFNNHIDAIYSMFLASDSIENIKIRQKEYCDNLMREGRYTKVLGCTKNSTIAGFLYTKFIKAEQCDIDINYHIAYTGNSLINVCDMVEIIGILMDNAIDAINEIEEHKNLVFKLNDFSGFDLSIKNPVFNITNNDIEKFFTNGYTTKESGSGIGLSKIKEYQKKYRFDIYAQIIKEAENDWIEFRVKENKYN